MPFLNPCFYFYTKIGYSAKQFFRCRSPPLLKSGLYPFPQFQKNRRSALWQKKYFVRVRGTLVQVTSKVYKKWHQARRKVKTLYEKDERNGLMSYDSMGTEDILGEETIPDQGLPSVEDSALERLLIKQLHQCLAQLSDTDQRLLHALYFEHMSERKFADLAGVHYMTVHSRKAMSAPVIKCKKTPRKKCN